MDNKDILLRTLEKEKELLKENLAKIKNKESGDKKKVENIQNENNALKQTNKELREQ